MATAHMATQAVILVPAEGGHVRQFYWSARALDDKVYRKRAEIVKVVVAPLKAFDAARQSLNDFQVTFVTERNKPFSFDRYRNVSKQLASIVVISHGGPYDGPIIGGGYQPWPAYDRFGADGNPYGGAGGSSLRSDSGSCSTEAMSCVMDTDPFPGAQRRPFTIDMLTPKAQKFWSEIGRSLRPDGKIIFLGCDLGGKSYISHVANASGRATFGPAEKCSAADWETVVRLVKSVEKGQPLTPMKLATPERR